MATVFIKPKNKLVVRDPATGKALPESGKTVTWSSYWQRRLQENSVEKATPPTVKKSKAVATTATANQE